MKETDKLVRFFMGQPVAPPVFDKSKLAIDALNVSSMIDAKRIFKLELV